MASYQDELRAVRDKIGAGARTLGEAQQGLSDFGLMLATGIPASLVGGVAGVAKGAGSALKHGIRKAITGGSLSDVLREGAKKGGEGLVEGFQDTARALTYEPRTDIGKRAATGFAKGIEKLAEHTVDPIGERSPLLGATIVAATQLVGPKGAKGKVAEPRFNPGETRQPLLPGVEPRTASEAIEQAVSNKSRALEQGAREITDVTRSQVPYEGTYNPVSGTLDFVAEAPPRTYSGREPREFQFAVDADPFDTARNLRGISARGGQRGHGGGPDVAPVVGDALERFQSALDDYRDVLRSPEVKADVGVQEALVPAQRQRLLETIEQNRDPAQMNAEAVDAFMLEMGQNPEALKYGLMPKDAPPGIRGMAEAMGEQAGKDIYVDHLDSAEPWKTTEQKTHSPGDILRDRYGDPVMRPKLHPRGDYPMRDAEGNVITDPVMYEGNELIDPATLEPTVRKRRALGGEEVRDRYGEPKYEYEKAEGGEPMYDERGRPKYEEVENPSYDENADLQLSTSGGSQIEVHGPTYGRGPHVDSQNNSGRYGDLLYQTLYADASRSGYPVRPSGLSGDNQLRLLANAIANYMRTGVNPRDVTNTLSGDAPRAVGRASGPEMLRAEAHESRRRLRDWDRVNPYRLRFDGENFLLDGKPVTPKDLRNQLHELTPDPEASKVGEKTLMRGAVFDWLRDQTPEAAREAAKKWGKYGPLAGAAAGGIGAYTMQDALRDTGEVA